MTPFVVIHSCPQNLANWSLIVSQSRTQSCRIVQQALHLARLLFGEDGGETKRLQAAIKSVRISLSPFHTKNTRIPRVIDSVASGRENKGAKSHVDRNTSFQNTKVNQQYFGHPVDDTLTRPNIFKTRSDVECIIYSILQVVVYILYIT